MFNANRLTSAGRPPCGQSATVRCSKKPKKPAKTRFKFAVDKPALTHHVPRNSGEPILTFKVRFEQDEKSIAVSIVWEFETHAMDFRDGKPRKLQLAKPIQEEITYFLASGLNRYLTNRNEMGFSFKPWMTENSIEAKRVFVSANERNSISTVKKRLQREIEEYLKAQFGTIDLLRNFMRTARPGVESFDPSGRFSREFFRWILDGLKMG